MKKKRFESLQSNGPVFPEAYKGKGYTLAGEKLTNLAEEMLWKAARFIDSDYETEAFYSNNKNMKNCLFLELTAEQQKLSWPEEFIPTLKKMKKAQEQLKEEKKTLTKEEKLAIKQEKDQLKETYGTAILNGESVPLSGYMIEDSGWILTRGADPRKFLWKYSVEEKDVTLNIVKGNSPKGWKGKVISDNTTIWVMKYKIKCGIKGTKNYKELNKIIAFAPSVSVRQNSNEKKYDKAKDILKNWKKIQAHIYKGVLAGDESAMIAYLIQMTGIRVGGERDLDLQADTKGASTLICDNISFIEE